MSTDTSAVREALRKALLKVPDLNAYARWPGALSAPAAVVMRRQTVFNPAFDVAADLQLSIKVLVATGSEDSAGQDLDAYMAPSGPRSVRAAIEKDPTLCGLVDFISVETAETEEITTYKGNDYLSADLTLVIG